MYQIIESILRNPLDTTKIRFIYANVTYEDILMKQELDAMVCDQFEVNILHQQMEMEFNRYTMF